MVFDLAFFIVKFDIGRLVFGMFFDWKALKVWEISSLLNVVYKQSGSTIVNEIQVLLHFRASIKVNV